MSKEMIAGRIVFNPAEPYQEICGEQGVRYKQKHQYFDAAGKPAQLAPRDTRSDVQKELDELRAEHTRLLADHTGLQVQLGKLQLCLRAPEVKAPVTPPANTSVVDTVDGKSTSKTLTLSGIRKAG